MMRRRIILVVVAVLVLITISACAGTTNNPEVAEQISAGEVHLKWIEVNPPPGVPGPCYAYFIIQDDGTKWATGYSGVYCKD